MTEPSDDPKVVFQAGWLKSGLVELLKAGPAWGGWALAGYLVLGHGHDLMGVTRQNAALLASMLKLTEALVQSTGQQHAEVRRLFEESLSVGLVSCWNAADDVTKRRDCRDRTPAWLRQDVLERGR